MEGELAPAKHPDGALPIAGCAPAFPSLFCERTAEVYIEGGALEQTRMNDFGF